MTMLVPNGGRSVGGVGSVRAGRGSARGRGGADESQLIAKRVQLRQNAMCGLQVNKLENFKSTL